MSEIKILEVEPELYAAAQRRASVMGLTIDEYVVGLIRRDVDGSHPRSARKDWLERAAALPRTSITNEELLASLDEGRAERWRSA